MRIATAFCIWYAREYGAPLQPHDLTQDAVQRYLQWCQRRVKPNTLAQRRSGLRWLGQYLVRLGVLDVNPLAPVASITQPSKTHGKKRHRVEARPR
jgi:site-specific recombinase XerC